MYILSFREKDVYLSYSSYRNHQESKKKYNFLTYCYKLAVYGCGVQSIQKDQNIFFRLVSFPAKSKGNWD